MRRLQSLLDNQYYIDMADRSACLDPNGINQATENFQRLLAMILT